MVFRTLPGADIEAPPMPGAFEHFAIQGAFTEWPPGVRAGIIDRSISSIHVADGEKNAFDLNGSANSRRNLIRSGHRDIISL